MCVLLSLGAIIAATFPILTISQICSDTYFELNGKEFNLNHLKNHLPPHQRYTDRSNLYGVTSDKKLFIFFNINDLVRKQKIDKHQIANRCNPVTDRASLFTNKPVACIPETDLHMCPDKKPCWLPLGACNNATPSFITDENKENIGIQLLYSKGNDLDRNFLVQIKCCKTDTCMKSDMTSPLLLNTTGCALEASHCVEIVSPYGCDCETRAAMDVSIGKKEFHCDATPHGDFGGTSLGTWLVIILCVAVALYLGIGMGYNYKEGRRGTEMVPHLEMWQDLGALIHDGYRYVISCGEYREGIQYDAIG